MLSIYFFDSFEVWTFEETQMAFSRAVMPQWSRSTALTWRPVFMVIERPETQLPSREQIGK